MNRFDVGLGAGFGAIVVVGIVALSSMHPAPPTPLGRYPPTVLVTLPASTTAATAAPTARPAPTAAPTPAPTPFAGLVSTGGSIYPKAQVLITSCVNHPSTVAVAADSLPTGTVGTLVTMRGTIRNTDAQADDYIVSIGTDVNQGFGVGIGGPFSVNPLKPGATRAWSVNGYVTNAPTQQPVCDVLSVLAEPA